LVSSRRSRSTLGALLASTFILTGAASAQAAPTIASPTVDAYINDTTPTVQFDDVAPGMDINLEVGGEVVGTTPAADIATGSGEVTADEDVSSLTNNRFVQLVVREDDGGPANGAFDTVDVSINQIPSLSGPADDTTWSAAGIDYSVTGAIPLNDVVLYSDGDEVARETADADGEVASLKPDAALSPGPHTLTAVTVDDAQVESSPETIALTVTPSAPLLSGLFNNAQLNQSPPAVTVTGVDEDASTVTLYEVIHDEGEDPDPDTFSNLGETTLSASDGTETVSLITPLSPGEHTLLARQTVNGTETDDYQSGNVWTTVEVNSGAPTLSSDDAGKLLNRTPYFDAMSTLRRYSIDSTNSVKFYVNGAPAGSDPTGYDGDAYFHPETLADGAYAVYAVTVDDLGHESTARSNEVTFTLDTVAPAAPTFTSPTAGAALTTNTPLVSVHSEPGARVYLYAGDYTDDYSTIADANGNATFTLSRALAEGENTLGAYASDAAGNYGDYGESTFNVKTVATAPPVVPPVATPVAPVATPTPTATTPAAPSKVTLSSSTLSASKPVKVGFTIKKAGTVKVTITKVVNGKTVTVATVSVKVKAGKGTYTLRTKVGGMTLKKGSFKVSMQTVNGKTKSKAVSAKVSVR
jgi:hypothetical protein